MQFENNPVGLLGTTATSPHLAYAPTRSRSPYEVRAGLRPYRTWQAGTPAAPCTPRHTSLWSSSL